MVAITFRKSCHTTHKHILPNATTNQANTSTYLAILNISYYPRFVAIQVQIQNNKHQVTTMIESTNAIGGGFQATCFQTFKIPKPALSRLCL